ncbi:MAG TPA: hypothetical protein VFE42_00795 [Chloroflexota bacterium]|nr:hypothetical protein [Chloroflexota bacterium]
MQDEIRHLDFAADETRSTEPAFEERAYVPRSKTTADFTDENAQPSRHVIPFESKPYDPEPHREQMRGWLAISVLALVALCVIAALVFIGIGRLPGASLIESVLPQVVTLAASALGFYFGGQYLSERTAQRRGGEAKDDRDRGR